MPKEQEQRAEKLDPKRGKVFKSEATHAGAPGMNNPQNALSDPQPSTMRPDGLNLNVYGNSGEQFDQMGGVYANPPSGLQQSATFGQGLNAWAPYGQQPQPPSSKADEGEAQRLNMGNPGAHTWIGISGQPATTTPGGLPGNMPGQSPDILGLTGMPSAEAAVDMKPKGMNTKSGKR